MPDTFINLSCANCGAKLAVYDDMERFACRYCGTEMIVQRRGDTVALKAVTEAIQKVQAGTDRTAAELAIVRLEKELQIAKSRERQLLSVHDKRVVRPIAFGGLAVLIGIVACFNDGVPVGMAFLVVGVAGIVYGWRRELAPELVELKATIRKTEQRLAEAKAVVDR